MPATAGRLTALTRTLSSVERLQDPFERADHGLPAYVLAIAAYNAGSHNARSWISEWGDPRSRSVDVVDWIELIPFSETRNYVQRVTENLQVYRYRLAGRPTPIELERDLHRGRH